LNLTNTSNLTKAITLQIKKKSQSLCSVLFER